MNNMNQNDRNDSGSAAVELAVVNRCKRSGGGVKVSFEYPGYIELLDGNGWIWAIGRANENWAMHRLHQDGEAFGPFIESRLPSTGPQDSEKVFDWIMNSLNVATEETGKLIEQKSKEPLPKDEVYSRIFKMHFNGWTCESYPAMRRGDYRIEVLADGKAVRVINTDLDYCMTFPSWETFAVWAGCEKRLVQI